MAAFDHVKVAIRCRPLTEEERTRVQVIIKTDGDKLIAFYPESKEGLLYNYDYFFPEETTQLDVFQVVGQEMVELALQGYNSCCLGYGPSAAGKTHTLFGSSQEHGIIQMTTKELFQRISAQAEHISYDVSLTYWEMNNDEIRDALDINNTANLVVRKNPKLGGIYIPKLTEVSVSNWEELDEAIMKGNITRITLSEQRSARWHGFLKLKLVKHDHRNADHVTTSTMMFGHLKGADRVGQKGASGSIMKHGSSVNKSITLLGAAMLHVVEMRRRKMNEILMDDTLDEDQIKEKQQHLSAALPQESESLFAECKLTQVLTEPFSGTCATIILSNVSTTDYHETTDTLEHLQNAQQIPVLLKRHVHVTKAGKVHKELEAARSQVPETKCAPGHPLTETQEKVKRLEEKYSHLIQGGERPETPPDEHPDPEPMELPASGRQWRVRDAKANKHGNRATVYMPTRTGKNTYKGQWANSMKSGYGEQVTPLSRYVGQWSGGMRDGEGTLWGRKAPNETWVRIYKGCWRSDKRHGLGTHWYPNGDIYEGYWADGKRSGIGKLFMANGDKIEGQWRNDKTEGLAILYLENGDWFEGHWHNGLREGQGTWYYESRQQLYHGEWHLGVAKCGTIEDMPPKTTNEKSHFLPRIKLRDADGVITQTKVQLRDQRMAIAAATGEAAPEECMEDIPEEDLAVQGDVEPESLEFVSHEEVQHDIEEYIEVMDPQLSVV